MKEKLMFEEIINILLIEDEEFDIRRVMNTIAPFKDTVHIDNYVSNGQDALDLLSSKSYHYDIVIMDFQIAGGLMGEVLIEKIKGIDPTIQIIVITKMTVNISDYNFAHRLLASGAFWYCTKYPVDIDEFIYQPTDFMLSIFNASEKCRLERERARSNQKLKRNIEDILLQKRIVGNSEQIEKLRDDISRLAKNDVNVLIRGASGTGKELVAYNIHYRSNRKYENIIIINCGSIPNDLVESELFGYEKGAFTGADRKKMGLFELANNGTIFLDEVTELPLQTQVKLLRVIQSGEIEKIGRQDKLFVDIRIIAATNKNVEEEVKARRFREDLYYRLNVLPVFVPELKKRDGDIRILAEHFLTHMSIDMVKQKPLLDESAYDELNKYSFPGNIRELKNIVQRLLFLDELHISAAHIKSVLGYGNMSFNDEDFIDFDKINKTEPLQLREMEVLVREKYFTYIRRKCNSDAEAAKVLGLAPPNYHRMTKELGIK
jgi:two-component system, NtrC family, response regulator AtoC